MKKMQKIAIIGVGLLCLAAIVGVFVFHQITKNEQESLPTGTVESSDILPDDCTSGEDVTTDTPGDDTTVSDDETTSNPVDGTDEPETTVSEVVGTDTEAAPVYVITQAEFEAINAAWSGVHGENASYLNSLDDIKLVGEQGDAWAYLYGRFNGCLVLFNFGPTGESSELDVAGYNFYFAANHCLWVCKDATYYTLTQAYENGFLTEDQIGAIAAAHRENMDKAEYPNGK